MGIATILRSKGSDVATCEPETPVADIVQLLMSRGIGAVPIMEGSAIVGIVSERDIVRCMATRGGEVLTLAAREVMTAPAIVIGPGDSVPMAMEMMTDRRIRHLPVVDSGRLVGLVSIGDLVKQRIEEAEGEALALKDYITAS